MIIHYHPLSHDQMWDKGNSTISRCAFPDAIFQPCWMLDHWRVWIMSLHCHNREDLPWPRSGPCINGPSMTCRGTCSSFLAWQVATKISHGIQWNERNLTGTPAKFDARPGFPAAFLANSRLESRVSWDSSGSPQFVLIFCCPIPNLQSASSSVSPSMNLSMPLMSLGNCWDSKNFQRGSILTDSTCWDNCLPSGNLT